MHNDVIADQRRRLDQTPIQANRSPGRTRTPSGTLIANRNSPNLELMLTREFKSAGPQFIRSDATEVCFNVRPEIACGSERNRDFANRSTPSRFRLAEPDRRQNSSKKYFRSVLPFRLRSAQLLFEPGFVLVRKFRPVFAGAAARNGHPGSAAREQTQNITPRLAVSDEAHRHGARSEVHPVVCGLQVTFPHSSRHQSERRFR